MASPHTQSAHPAYDRLIAWLDEQHVRYRILEHPPEGRTDIVSGMRGHDPQHAAKCMILMVKQGRKVTRFVLAVVPGNARINLDAVKALLAATYVSFASSDIAEKLAGAPMGAVLPFALDPSLELVADPSLLQSDELYFNAARLDRSMVLSSTDYAAIAKPRFAEISSKG